MAGLLSRAADLLRRKPASDLDARVDRVMRLIVLRRRPAFWEDEPVRRLCIEMKIRDDRPTLDAALSIIRGRFGERAPGRSALGRFWRQIELLRDATEGFR